jgi:hypothetical protein
MKWAGLAAKGNPSRPELFLGKGHVKPFLGFADDQMKRLLGQKGQKNIHRAELEDKPSTQKGAPEMRCKRLTTCSKQCKISRWWN